MTWWEVEEIAAYVSDVEAALDEWTMSNAQMRSEQHTVSQVTEKLDRVLSQTTEPDKKIFLEHLAGRIEDLRQNLTERLKRDVPS
ncbi:MAG: hypothetical protein ABFR90_03130 [Planctomycetota bacterium]